MVSKKSSPLISLSSFQHKGRSFLVILLYSLCILSLLSLLEWNPIFNHNSDLTENLPTIEEEREWKKIIDVPWVNIPDIKYENITFLSSPFVVNQCEKEYRSTAILDEPENIEINAISSGGKNITIFYGNPDDIILSYPWNEKSLMCEGEILNASVVLFNEGDSYHVYSMGIIGKDARFVMPFDWVSWVFIGGISGYLLLKLTPTPTSAKNSKLRNQNFENPTLSKDGWVMYDSWDFVQSNPGLDKYEEGEVIPEHPTKLHSLMGGVISPWIFSFGYTFLCLDLLLFDIFSMDGLGLEQFMNNRMDDLEWISCFLALFTVTFGPWVLIGKLVHLRESIMSTFGAFIKKKSLQTLINDVPTSTIRAAPVGRIEVAGVALSTSKGDFKHYIAGRTDESIGGIKNPDNWPIFRTLAKTRKDSWDPNHEFEFILNDGTKGIKVRMPRKNFDFGEPTSVYSNGFYRKIDWSIDEGDPVFVIGELIIDKNNEVYIGVDKKQDLKSVVFKGTEWTVLGKYRSYFEYIVADLIVFLVFIHIGLMVGGII
tara:strand:- start:5159 stop:6781 length:1623 start_codon:yes stop_codon:yes gene_type:complete